MRRKSEGALVRRNLTLPSDFVEQVNALRTKTESSSDSEVVRRALTTYEQFAEDLDHGITLDSVRPDGTVIPILMTSLVKLDGGPTLKANLIFHEGSDQRIDTLRSLTKATSDSEVVRVALNLYEILIKENELGSVLRLSYPSGEQETLRFWGVPSRPRGTSMIPTHKRRAALVR